MTLQTAPSSAASLELRLVSAISGEFFVPRYQRGYRWGEHEVERLLEDLHRSEGKPYCLQPVVVKKREDGRWELVDGQQRLTTLYLLFLFMQREGLQKLGPRYSMIYETRPGSEVYLRQPDAARRDENIDFFHIHGAYDCVRRWFEAHDYQQQVIANDIYSYLFKSVRVIWYEAPVELDSTTLFTRLNVGRIPLTDAELVKALLLTKSREVAVAGGGRTDRSEEIAAQWNGVERDLQDDDVWGFISDASAEECPTRMTLLLDTLAGGPRGRRRPRFHTFETLRQSIEEDPVAFWNRVLGLHALVLGWFEDRTHYHKIGYLVASGDAFADLVVLAQAKRKSEFEATLDARIRTTLDLSATDVRALSYDNDAHHDRLHRVLRLMNVETVRRMRHSSERYSFHRARDEDWSLEHIHAQHTQGLAKAEQWRKWLDLHRAALETLPGVDQATRLALIARLDAVGDPIERQKFEEVAREVTAIFSEEDESGAPGVHSTHSISNLALLSRNDNSQLNNAVFEVKRQRILAIDRAGGFIPICTRQVFLKYFTGADAQQIHFWSVQDRQSYLDAMIGPDGLVTPYLKPEDGAP